MLQMKTKYLWAKIGGMLGFLSGLIFVIMGWDNYGLLSLALGVFSSVFVLITGFLPYVFHHLRPFNIFYSFPGNILLIPIYTVTSALSWWLLGMLISKKEIIIRVTFIFYISLWVILGFFAMLLTGGP